MNKGKLRKFIVQSLNLSEFKNLCQDVSVNYDALPGQEIESKARELIEHLERRARIDQLFKRLKSLRPHFDENEVLEGNTIQGYSTVTNSNIIETDINYLIKSLQKIVNDSNEEKVQEKGDNSDSLIELSLTEIALFLAALPDDRSRTDDGRDGRMKNFREGWNKGSESRIVPNIKRMNFKRVTWRSLGWFIGALAGRDYASPSQTRAIFEALGDIRNSRDDKY